MKGVRPLEVSKAILASGETERSGFGAYSYVLLPRIDPNNARYRAIVQAWAALASVSSESNDEAQAVNITYMLTVRRPKPGESSNIEWLLSSYDTTRASRLAFQHHLSGAGPFVLTRTSPATFATGNEPVAVLDLSGSPAESMQAWLNHFVRASERPDRWAMNGATAWAIQFHDQLFALGGAATCTLDALPNGTRVLKLLTFVR